MMSQTISKKLLDRSCAWIRDHCNATNQEIPDELRELWVYDLKAEQAAPCGFHLAVFTFGFLQHELIRNKVPPEARQTIPASTIMEYFARWQLKLALAEISRKTAMQCDPLPLFDFTDDEEVRVFWRLIERYPH